MNRKSGRTIWSWRVADIKVTPQRRKMLDEATVLRLAPSIQRNGLFSPIRIRSDGTLVCGLHRLAAHERLGLEMIEVFVDDSDPIDAELDEIEENLARRELTVLERALAEYRQKVLYLQKYPESRRGMAGALAKHVQAKSISFATATTEGNGGGKRMVEQRVQIAEALGKETVALIAEAPIADNHSQLLALARAPEDLRHPVAVYLVEHTVTTVRTALMVVSGSAATSAPKPRRLATGALVETRGRLSGTAVLGEKRVRVQIARDHQTFALRYVGPAEDVQPKAIPVDRRPVTLSMTADIAAEVIGELPSDLATLVALGHPRAVYDPTGQRSARVVQKIAIQGAGIASSFCVRWLDATEPFPRARSGAVLFEVDRRPFLLAPNGQFIQAEGVRQAMRDALVRALRGVGAVLPDFGRLYRSDGTEWSFNRVSPPRATQTSREHRVPQLGPASP